MTTAASDLLTHLTALGVSLRLDGDTLHASPRTLITPEVRDQIRTHKAALIVLLTSTVVVDDDPGPWGFHSRLLDADVWLCLTEADASALRAEGVLAYLPAEIRALQAMKARGGSGFADKLKVIALNREVWESAIDTVEVPQT